MKDNLWQSPYVNIFKEYEIFKNFEKKGKVTEKFETEIGRRIFDISGNISISNYLDIKNYSKNSNLDLIGNQLYISFKPNKISNFFFFIDFILADNNRISISLSNKHKKYEKNDMTISIPFKIVSEKWTIIRLDVEKVFKESKSYPNYNIKRHWKHELIKIRACSQMKLRGIFTSDIIYDYRNLPKDFGFVFKSNQKWEDIYEFKNLPDISFFSDLEKQQKNNGENNKKSSVKEIKKIEGVDIKDEQQKENFSEVNKNLEKEHFAINNKFLEKLNQNQMRESDFIFLETEKQNQNEYIKKNKNDDVFKIKLNKIRGFTGKICPDLKIINLWQSNYLIHVSGKTIILTNIDLGKNNVQKHFKGHSDSITCFDINKEAKILVSSQSGENPLSIIWDLNNSKISKKKFNVEIKNVRTVSISKNAEYVVFVGETKISKDCITIYSLTSKFPSLISKHVSDYNILCLKFSPLDQKKLVSCGRENIKFWRLKKTHLTGCPVILNNYTRQTIFTVLDFDVDSNTPQTIHNNKVIVASQKGLIFIVNYAYMNLQSVYKIHDFSICTLSVKGGFCVTGSQDEYLRVWPLDFSEFYLEAKYDGVVIATDISEDSLNVAVGTINGFLGILNLTHQSCTTVGRSHSGEILGLSMADNFENFVSLSNDLSIRVWKTQSLKESHEFNYFEKDECTCISVIDNDHFVAGFQSGTVRLFNIPNLKIIKELVYNKNKIEIISKSPNSEILIIGDKEGVFSIVNILNDFELIKYLEIQSSHIQKISCTIDAYNKYISIIGLNNNTINIYDFNTFECISSNLIKNSFIHSVKFNQNKKDELMVLTCKGGLIVYFISEGNLKHLNEMVKCHDKYIADVVSIDSFYATCGGDGYLKIWRKGKNKDLDLIKIIGDHGCPIYCLAYNFNDNKLLSAGAGDGIFEWDVEFLSKQQDTGEKFIPPLNFQQDLFENNKIEKKDTFDKVLKIKKDFQETYEIDPDLCNFIEDIYGGQNKIVFKKADKENLDLLNEAENIQLMKNNNKTLKFVDEICFQKKDYFYEEKNEKQKDFLKFKNNLSFCHYFEENDEKNIPKINAINKRTNFLLKKIMGINVSSINNLIWNLKSSNLIYFVENKIIFEKLEKNQNQKIIHLEELISGIFISPNFDYLIVSTSKTNQKSVSPIYIITLLNYETRSIKYHTKGVQNISVSEDNCFVMTVGSFMDKKIGIFKLNNNLELVFESSTENTPNSSHIFFSKKYKKYFCFITNGSKLKIISFKKNTKEFEEIDLLLDPSNEVDFDITSIISIMQNSLSYLLLGSNKGDIIIINFIENEKLEINSFKEIYRKKFGEEIVFIKKSEINNTVVFSTKNKKLFFFNFDENFINQNENYKIKNLSFDAIVMNVSLDMNFKEGLVLLENEEIVYISFEEEQREILTKLMSSKNQIFEIISIEINSKKFLLVIFDNGKVNIYKLENLEFYTSLKISQTVCFALYIKFENILLLSTQEQEIFLVTLDDFLDLSYYQLNSFQKVNKGYINNYIKNGIYFYDHNLKTTKILLFTYLGHFLLGKFSKETNLIFHKIEVNAFCLRANNVIKNNNNNYFATSTLNGEIFIFKNNETSSNYIEETEFESVSSFKIENAVNYDFNWIKMIFSPNKDEHYIYLIANNIKALLKYDFSNKQVS